MSDKQYTVTEPCQGVVGTRAQTVCGANIETELLEERDEMVGCHLADDHPIGFPVQVPITLSVFEMEITREYAGHFITSEERNITVAWSTDDEREYIAVDLTESQARQLHEVLGRFLEGWTSPQTWRGRN